MVPTGGVPAHQTRPLAAVVLILHQVLQSGDLCLNCKAELFFVCEDTKVTEVCVTLLKVDDMVVEEHSRVSGEAGAVKEETLDTSRP